MAKKKKGLQITLGIALAIILFALVNLGTYTYYPSPDYNDYCDPAIPRNLPDDYTQCNADYDQAQLNYNNNIFYVYVGIGLALSVLGLFIASLSFQIVGIGTGTALLVEGIMRNLQNKQLAFAVGVLAFLILSYFVWKKVDN